MGFNAFGFSDRDEFNQMMLRRSGNLTWLSKSGNDHLSRSLPDDRAYRYQFCKGHPQGQNIFSDISPTTTSIVDIITITQYAAGVARPYGGSLGKAETGQGRVCAA